MDYQKLKDSHEELSRDVEQYVQSFCKEHRELEADFKAEKVKTSEKLKDLYQSSNEARNTLTELTTTIKMLVQNMDKQYSSIENNYKSLEKQLSDINIRLARKEN